MANPQPKEFTTLSNELLEAIIQCDFTKRQRAILDLIFRLSYGIQRCKYCFIPQQTDFAICGVTPNHLKREINNLIEKKVIGREGPKYWIQKDYDLWDVPKHFDKDKMNALIHHNLYSQNGNSQNRNSRKGKPKVPKTGSDLFPKQEVNGALTIQDDSVKKPPKESIKESIKKDIYKVFEFWNSKDMHHHLKLTDEMESHVGARIKDFGVELVIEAIENYARILKDDRFWLTYTWTLVDFTKSMNRFEKFLSHNRPYHKYLNTKKMSEAQLESWLQDRAGRHRSPCDNQNPVAIRGLIQESLGEE